MTEPDQHPEDPPESRVDENRVAGYARLMRLETILYREWEKHNQHMTWAGEALGAPIEDNTSLYVAELAQKIHALGGHLELRAVFPDHTLLLLREAPDHETEQQLEEAVQPESEEDDHFSEPADDGS